MYHKASGEEEKVKIIVISGPSGSGKSTIASKVEQSDPGKYEIVRSFTTRKPRTENEFYTFVSNKEFERMENEGMFLETNVYNGNNSRYGTPRPEVERIIKEGKSPILEIDVHGREQVAEWILDHPEHSLQSIFISVPPDILKKRLTDRGDAPASIEQRLKAAAEEVKSAERYDAIVVNDELERAVSEVISLL